MLRWGILNLDFAVPKNRLFPKTNLTRDSHRLLLELQMGSTMFTGFFSLLFRENVGRFI